MFQSSITAFTKLPSEKIVYCFTHTLKLVSHFIASRILTYANGMVLL